MGQLKRIKIEGFKSIRSAELELRPINVLIGANGSGKSNLVSFFRMLNEMLKDPGQFQSFVHVNGKGNSLLHFGAKRTPTLSAELDLEADRGLNRYSMRLVHAAPDTLIFTDERVQFFPTGGPAREPRVLLGRGREESNLRANASEGVGEARAMYSMLTKTRVYHFHDTSAASGMRLSCRKNDYRYLYPQAENLAAMIYRYSQTNPPVYNRIVAAVRGIAPTFWDFSIAPSPFDQSLLLEWRQRDSEYVLGPHQLSDGTIRGMALATLFLQPEDTLPDAIVIDEPELGLHPQALSLLAGMVQSVSYRTQVILATQSSELVSFFEPEDIVVVHSESDESTFNRLNREELAGWLEEYNVGELWRKNVISAGPLS